MSGARAAYSVVAYSPQGFDRRDIQGFTSLTYAKSVNAAGSLSMKMSRRQFDRSGLMEDSRILVWRSPAGTGGPSLEMSAQWLVTSILTTYDNDGSQTVSIKAQSALDLLDRRIIAFLAGTAGATANGKADDMMKRVVNENVSAAAGVGRDWSPYFIVDRNTGLGASIQKQLSYRSVLSTIQEMAKDSETQGTPVYFDVVSVSPSVLMFKTWAGQPGVDRTVNPYTSKSISLESGALRSATWGFDSDGKYNVVYGLGQESGGVRQIVAAVDTMPVTVSPFWRREETVDARGAELTAELLGEARAELARVRNKKVVQATIANNSVVRYGVDWTYGDRLNVEIEGQRYACLVESVSVTVDKNGTDSVSATLRYSDAR
jgi:hypothetical protein